MITGISVALVTPLDDAGRLDHAGLERIVSQSLAAGIGGISPVGSTGEGPRLTREQRLEVTSQVRSMVPPQTPVLPGVPCSCAEEGLREIEELAGLGCAAALVAPPSYYPLAEDEVRRFYELLADRSALPVLLYNIPVFTKVPIEAAAAGALAGHPRIAGIKDSSRDLEYFQQVVVATAAQPDFAVLTGTDTLLVASLLLGGHGAIAASANLTPGLAVGVYRAYHEGRLDQAQHLQQQLVRLVGACRRGPFPAGWKAALQIAGLCDGQPASPASPLAAALRDKMASDLAALGIVPAPPGMPVPL